MRPRKNVTRLFTAFAMIAITVPQTSLSDEPVGKSSGRGITVEAQPLATALQEFSDQSGLQIAYVATLADNMTSKGTHHAQTAGTALSEILDSTGLEYRFVNDDTVAIGLALGDERSSDSGNSQPTPRSVTMAQASETTQNRSSEDIRDDRDRPGEEENDKNSAMKMEEIIVTGTHIRGGNSSSPILTFDRAAIERSGYATTEQLMQSLPQNLSTFSDATFGQINGGADGSFGLGSGINLRGLGGDATLVLLDGRRLASAAQGHYVDVSLIPLSAVERVEVLTDGASATYGSDAVGGVVNIILRKGVEGAESRLRYGTVTQGDSDELQLGQSFGQTWDRGSALVSYDYFRRTALDASDRDFVDLSASGILTDLKLLPRQERHGLLLMGSQALSDRVEVSADMLFGRRDSALAYQIVGLPPIPIDSKVSQISASLGTTISLGRDWEFRGTGSFSGNETEQETVSPVLNSLNEFRTHLWGVDVAADGAIGRLPGGAVRLALGSQFRKEKLRDDAEGAPDNPLVDIDRDVMAAYGELFFPLVGEENRAAGLQRLELSVAARFEEYSDFGSTSNPKAGISWSPLRRLNFRTTFGKSFKAPLLSELNPAAFRPFAYSLIDPTSPTGATPVLVLQGSVLGLGPERATTWTAGVDFTPDALPGLGLELTYFDIDIDDRIASPLPFDERLFSILLDPTLQDFINRNPDLAEVSDLLSRPNFANVTGAPLEATDIGAIADSRLINIAGSAMRGVDFSLAYDANTQFGDISLQLLGDYLFADENQIRPDAAAIDTLNTVYHQPDLRIRSIVSWSREGLTATGIVNYVDSYRDSRTEAEAGPNQRSTVASWTTVDASLIWVLGEQRGEQRGGLWTGTTLTLSALNVFDRAPPFIASPLGLHFDGVNSTPLGRWVALSATKQW